ncbi:hypothetical protein [Chrysiogenes arsenatis]|uniref:hypothetical protein n=1 Tax=Chrysiogenes arsenatis TaxID=309797 RepID=UPI0004260B3C|nr:hypothetical protein [Chrysiogenes arsenatis]
MERKSLLATLGHYLLLRNVGVFIFLSLSLLVFIIGRTSLEHASQEYQASLRHSSVLAREMLDLIALYDELEQRPSEATVILRSIRQQLDGIAQQVASSGDTFHLLPAYQKLLEATGYELAEWYDELNPLDGGVLPPPSSEFWVQHRKSIIDQVRHLQRLGEMEVQRLFLTMDQLNWILAATSSFGMVILLALLYPVIEHRSRRIQLVAKRLAQVASDEAHGVKEEALSNLEMLTQKVVRQVKKHRIREALLAKALGQATGAFPETIREFYYHRILWRGIESQSDPIAIVEENGIFLYTNTHFEGIFHCTRHQNLEDIDPTPESESLVELVGEALQKGYLATYIEILTVPRGFRANRFQAYDFTRRRQCEYLIIHIEGRPPTDDFFVTEEGGWGTA